MRRCGEVPRPASATLAAAVVVAMSMAIHCNVVAAEPVSVCAGEPALAQLDFWLGDWQVCSAGKHAGRDRVAKILDSCAVTEDWVASDGSRGQSLFYYLPLEKTWKQVWVTDLALRPGGLKEKKLVARFADGGVRFQGTIALPDGRRILDRTILRPMADRSVHQRIELSRDGGDTWATNFDADYRRPKSTADGAVAAEDDPCR